MKLVLQLELSPGYKYDGNHGKIINHPKSSSKKCDILYEICPQYDPNAETSETSSSSEEANEETNVESLVEKLHVSYKEDEEGDFL